MKVDYDSVKNFILKYGIWFLIPTLLLYLIDFVTLLLSLATALIAVFIIIQFLVFLGGIFLGIMDIIPGSNYDVHFKYRINKFFPMFKWGWKLTKWMMEDLEKEIAKSKADVEEEIELV